MDDVPRAPDRRPGSAGAIYQEEDDYGTNVLEFFEDYQDATPGRPLYENALTIYPTGPVRVGRQARQAPTVSWIVPTSGQSEHPAYLPASGANYLASKLNAVAENRGSVEQDRVHRQLRRERRLFDHVVPPLPPAGHAG